MACGHDAEQDDELETHAVSAFAEAFNNIVVHGYAGLPPGNVDVEISWSIDAFVIKITDQGHSFDPASVEVPDLDLLPEGGLGLFIMRSFMDEVDYQPGPPNVLRLVKHHETSRFDLGDGPALPPSSTADTRKRRGASASRSDWRMKAVASPPTTGQKGCSSTLVKGSGDARAIGGSRRS